ncbi:MAG: hypothetical protein CMI01_16285 [Oceanospirillaceae bacterium]|nr:hypothetical protein [Oceanospirillaceae bacterium]
MKTNLLVIHRWIGVLLFPLFLLIILTGAVLAFKPIVSAPEAPGTTSSVPIADVIHLIDSQPQVGEISSISRIDAGETWRLQGLGDFSLSSGERIGDGADDSGAIFDFAKRLHKDLLIGLGWVVEYATWAFALAILVGVIIYRPHLKQGLLGWHQRVGLWLLPGVALVPVTALMMTLHIGQPEISIDRNAKPLSVTGALQLAEREPDFGELIQARRFKAGSVLLETAAGTWVASGEQLSPVVGDYWPKMLHEGTWGGALSGSINFVLSLVLLGLSGTGFVSWLRRMRADSQRSVQAGARTLIVYASQTGTAQRIAKVTTDLFGMKNLAVNSGSIAAYPADQWPNYDQVLVVASTTGEGDLPDSARSWMKTLGDGVLKGSHVALLALGDRRYQHFCGGGHRLRQALLDAGAQELEPLTEVDGEPGTTWQQWLNHLSSRFDWGLDTGAIDTGAQQCQATLVERTRLDSHRDPDAPQSYSIVLQLPTDQVFHAGDLLRFQPAKGERVRSYSIGASSDLEPGKVRLTVGLLRYIDHAGREVLGRASSELCLNWPLGEARAVELVSHPGFNPPADPKQPIILLATGCGIAPFLGFIEQRAQAVNAGPVWLLFGNRHKEGDYLYRGQLESWRDSGVITELDTTFSRDGSAERYITERLEKRGDQLLDWIEDGAVLYICGRASTLGLGAERVLVDLIRERYHLSEERAQGRLESWILNGQLHRDLFD